MPVPAGASPALKGFMGKLNPAQMSAVDSGGHTLVVACPGSGKTRTLVAKAAAALVADDTSRVVLLTFTREAAQEMRSRIVPLLSDGMDAGVDAGAAQSMLARLTVGTFHSVCARTLSDGGLREGAHLISPGEEWMYYQRTADACGVDPEIVARTVERMKTDPRLLDMDAPGLDPAASDTTREMIFRVYSNFLAKNALWDYADLIRETVKGMRAGTLKRWPATAVLVDEYQDTDALQYELLALHRDHASVTVVGDDDQGIYSFRHAMGTDGMVRFETEFRARRITLATNYRSRPEVIRMAARLIENNHERMPKAMQAGQRVAAVEPDRFCTDRAYATMLDEARHALSTLSGFLLEHPDKTAAILARTNPALNTIEAEHILRSERGERLAPIVRLGGGGITKDYLGGLLRSLWHAAARPTTRRGIETIFSHLLDYKYEQIQPAVRGGFAAVLRHLDNLKARESGSGNHQALHELAVSFKAWRVMLKGRGAADPGTVEQVSAGAVLWLLTAVAAQRKMERLGERDRRVIEAIHRRFCAMRGTIPQRLAALANASRQAPKKAEGEGEGDGSEEGQPARDHQAVPPGSLALLTLHGAKGMEFDRVWILQANEGSIPHKKNPVTAEERRLFYVGVTRAKGWLDVSYDMKNAASGFIKELGKPGFI